MTRSVPSPVRSLALAATGLAVVLGLSACDGGVFGSPVSPSPTEPLVADEGQVGDTEAPNEAVSVPPLHESVDDWPTARVVVDPGDGADLVPVDVLLAETPERRRHGLMEVPAVPDDVGMLFVYDEDQDGAFWMKGTLTELDIAWIDDTGRIVDVATMQPCTSDPCETWEPSGEYRTALEVRAGWLADNAVEVGDRVMRDRADGS